MMPPEIGAAVFHSHPTPAPRQMGADLPRRQVRKTGQSRRFVLQVFLSARCRSAKVGRPALRGEGSMGQRVSTVAFEGIEARAVDVQVQVAPGLPAFNIVGLPDKAVSE